MLTQQIPLWSQTGIPNMVFNIIKFVGFQPFKTYYSLFTRYNNSSFTVLLIYVDDILLSGTDLTEIQHIKDFLLQQFSH